MMEDFRDIWKGASSYSDSSYCKSDSSDVVAFRIDSSYNNTENTNKRQFVTILSINKTRD